MAKNSKTGINIAKKTGLLDQIKEPLYVHILWANTTFFLNIDRKYQKEYYEELRDIFLPIIKDTSFKYKFFTDYDRFFIKLVTSPNWTIAKTILYATKTRRFIRKNAKKFLQATHIYNNH